MAALNAELLWVFVNLTLKPQLVFERCDTKWEVIQQQSMLVFYNDP